MKKTALELIAEERQRQIDVYGYTDEYLVKTEDDYGEGELAQGAAAYALPDALRDYEAFNDGSPYVWPWDRSYWNSSPEDRIKELAKAGAMIVAEIDRLNYIASNEVQPG